MSDQMYSIKYYNDEITLDLDYCKNPAQCTCTIYPDLRPKCGYPLDQARQKLVDYYRKRADDIEQMSDKELLRSQGIYV